MRGDLRFGLILVLLVSLALAPRFLPKLEELPLAVSPTAAIPPGRAPANSKAPTGKAEPAGKAGEDHNRDSSPAGSPAPSALTDVVPDGYSGPVLRPTPSGGGFADKEENKKSTTDRAEPAGERETPTEADGPIITEFLPHRKSEQKPQSSVERETPIKLPEVPNDEPAATESEKTKSGDEKPPLPIDNVRPPGKFPIPPGKEGGRPVQAQAPAPKHDESPGKRDAPASAPVLPNLDAERPIVAPASNDVKTRSYAVRGRPKSRDDLDASRDRATTDRSSKTKKGGPIHPYFQQYLDRGEYFVRDGDTLKQIAYRLYRDEGKADAIRTANPGLIKNSDDVRPGMMLKLP